MTARRLPVPLTDEQWDVVQQLATTERRSMAQQVIMMLDDWIKANPKKLTDRTKTQKS